MKNSGQYVTLALTLPLTGGWSSVLDNKIVSIATPTIGALGVNNLTPLYTLDVGGSGNFQSGVSTNLINVTGLNFSSGSGTPPSQTTFLIPVQENIYGATTSFLGEPSGWVNILVSGRTARMPFYF